VIKRLIFIIFMLVSAMIATSCNQYIVGEDKTIEQVVRSDETFGERSLILDGPILIDNVPIMEMTYTDVLEHFGEPKETKIVKAIFPLNSYYNLYVLKYDDIEMQFYTDKENQSIPDKQRKVFRFDLTGSKYAIGELGVGVTVEEYLEKFGEQNMYSMTDVINFSSSNSAYSSIDQFNLSALTRLLIISKPENYYSEYEYVFYEQGITGEGYPIGLALLIKDNRIDRIVYGYPNGS